MVLEKIVGLQKPYLKWHKDNLGFKFLQQDGLEDIPEVVIVPFTIASLALFRHLDGNKVVVVSENPHHGEGKRLADPEWSDDLPATVKTAVMTGVEINHRNHVPYGWYNWTGTPPTRGAGYSLLAKTLMVKYRIQDHDGEYQLNIQPDNLVYECHMPGTYSVVRREGSNSVDGKLTEQAGKELLEWHVDRVPPHHVNHHSDKWREYAVVKLGVQCSLISGRFEVALRDAANFFNITQGMMILGAEGIVERDGR